MKNSTFAMEIFIKGILIGILVSAPMGPIGVMCVQRTLNEGRMHGFMTGLGATFSDLVYAVLAGVGVGFIVEFLEQNYTPIQIIGSVVILILGYYTFNNNPAKKLKKQELKQDPFLKDFVTSFFLNLSNIGIFVFFLVLFARFNFIDTDDTAKNIIGFIAIGIGATFWWFLVSYMVGKLRGRFNPRGLMVFNRIFGVILIVIALVGIVTGVWDLCFPK